MAVPRSETRRRTIADRFASLCAAVVRRLPFGLASLVPPSLLGFAVINGFTFGVDLLLLTLFHGGLGWPIGPAITLGYVVAFGLSFVLNRTLNFRSHAPVGRQTAMYVLVVAVNYVAILLGIGSGLVALGLEYHLSRIIAGMCEGVFMYCALRWVVFASWWSRRGAGPGAPPHGGDEQEPQDLQSGR